MRNMLVVKPIDVTPVLYMADGTEYALPVVHLPIAGVATLDINDAIRTAPGKLAGHTSEFGSAGLRFSFVWSAIQASIENLNTTRSLIYNFYLQDVSSSATKDQTAEGLWWKQDPDIGGFVALSNSSATPIQATYEVVGHRPHG